MKSIEMWIAIGTAIAATGIALGVSTPKEKLTEIAAESKVHESRLNDHDVHFAKLDQKLDNINDGVKEIKFMLRRNGH